MTNFDQGLILGLTMPWFGSAVEKKLVGYSYNGVILPKLPEYDTEAYPYAYIYRSVKWNRYYLVVQGTVAKLTAPFRDDTSPRRYLFSSATIGYFVNGEDGAKEEAYWCDGNGNAYMGQIDLIDTDGASVREIVWSNHDILDTDGSVYYSASSDPSPVYGTKTPAVDDNDVTYYKFNGVVLPRLPAISEMKVGKAWPNGAEYWEDGWDITALPYMAICQSEDDTILYISLAAYGANTENQISTIAGDSSEFTVIFKLSEDGSKWECSTNGWLEVGTAHSAYPVLWSNSNVYYFNENDALTDTLCLFASDPIPVYE